MKYHTVLVWFTTLILLLFCPTSYSIRESNRDIYQTEKPQSIREIATKFYSKYKYQHSSIEDYIAQLKKWNPDIQNWELIPEDKKVNINYPYHPFIGPSYIPDHAE